MDESSEERIVALEGRIAQLEAILAQNVNDSNGSSGESIRNAYIPPLAEPPKLAAFSVVWDEGMWKMYYPSGCLLCDGQNPTGINAGADGMVSLAAELKTVGIRATWKKSKKTGVISELAAEISGTSTSSIIVTESGTGDNAVWQITANIPVAKIENFAVNQIANGFISISSGTGEQPKDGKLTIRYGSTEKGTFTANQSSDTEVVIPEPEIPTVNDGKLKVQFGSDAAVDKFSANQQSDSTLALAKVAATGSYNDLADKPTIPQPVQPNDGKLKVQFGTDAAVDKFSANQQSDSTLALAKVAATGSYNDLADKPTIPTLPTGTIKFIGEDGIIYDTTSHQLQIRVDSLDLATGEVTPGSWKMIAGGQAVAHA